MNRLLNPLGKLSIGAKLLIGFGLMIALLGAIVTTAYVGLIQTQRSEERLLEEHFVNVYDLASLRAGMNAERLAVAVMMELGPAERAPQQAELQRRMEMEESILERLRDRFRDDPRELERLRRLIDVRTALMQTRNNELLPALAQGRVAEAERLFVGIQLRRHEAIENIAKELEQGEVERAQRLVEQAARKARIYRFWFVLLGLGTGMISLMVAVASRRMVVTYLTERNKAAREAVEQFKLAESFFNHSISGFVVLDRDYNFLRVNAAYARASGRQVSNFVGRNHFEMYPSDAKLIFDEVVRSKRIYQAFARPFEYADQPERGVTYWDWTLVPVLDERGEVEYLVLSLNDVTERQRAEDALRRSEAALQEAQRIAQVGTWRWDIATDAVTWSEQLYRIFGLDLARPPPHYRDYAQILTDESMLALSAAVRHSRESGEPFEVEIEIRRADGARGWCINRGVVERGADGRVVAMHGTVHDITARRQSEQALRDSERLLRTVLQHLPVAVWLVDREGRILEANPAVQHIWGGTKQVYIDEFRNGKAWRPETGEPMRREDHVSMRALARGETCLNEQMEIESFDGVRKTLLASAVPIRDERNEITGAVVVHQDISDIRRAQAALRQREADLIEAQRVAHVGSWDWDIKTDTLTWSEETYRIFGRDAKLPLSYKEHVQLYAADSHARLAAAMERALREGTRYELDLELRRDGGTRWVTARGEGRRDAAGEICGLRGTVQDITARKLAEEAIKASEELLRLIAETIEDVFWISTPGVEEMLYISPAYERLWERSRESLYRSPRSFIDVVHLDDRPAVLDILERHRRGESYEIEYRIAPKSGAVRWMHERAYPIHDDEGRVRAMTGIVSDITKRKQAEEALRQSEREARARLTEIEQIYRSAPVGLLLLDHDYRFVRINEVLAEMNGLTAEEHLGHSILEVVPGLADQLAPLLRVVFERGEATLGVELHGARPGAPDEERDLLVNFIPFKTEAGEVIGLIGAVLDITERKALEDDLRRHRDHLEDLVRQRTAELKHANVRLQELDRLKSMFIASMSHELRTPLNTIIGFTGIILQGMVGAINAEQRKQLNMVKESAVHLLALINDVIDISKIEAGIVEVAMDTFDLADLVRDVAASFAVAAQAKGLSLSVRAPDGMVFKGDKRRMRQMLVNLISNAVKFTDRGGVEIALAQTRAGIEIEVRDTGIGIKQADMGKLFLSFSQIATEGRPKEGSGLGLYLSQKIAHLMGGHIAVRSTEGVGSVFTISLPAAAVPAAAGERRT
jgi:PAS domain S-box-containing protein